MRFALLTTHTIVPVEDEHAAVAFARQYDRRLRVASAVVITQQGVSSEEVRATGLQLLGTTVTMLEPLPAGGAADGG